MAAVELPTLVLERVADERAASRLLLVNRDPGPSEAAVPRASAIAVELVDLGHDGVDRAATRVWVNGGLAFAGGAPDPVAPAYRGPRAAVLESADALRIVLDPVVPFESEALVAVRVTSEVRGGVHALDESYAFRIEDRTAPKVASAQATGPRTVRVGFDEDVQVQDASQVRLEALDTPAVVPLVATASAEGAVVVLTLDTEMSPDVAYKVRAGGVMDDRGNPASPPFDVATFAGFRPPRPARRRFDLWTMLPGHNRRDDATGDLHKLIACFQEVTDLLLADIDRFPDLFDLERAPESFLDRMLEDFGNPFPFELDELAKRRLLSVLVPMVQEKGTAKDIRNAVRFFLGLEIQIVAYSGSTLVLGESQLGVDWELGPSARFARYAFEVHVGVVLTETERRQLRALVHYLRPAHTHFVRIVEPTVPETFDHWELGISALSETTLLH